MKILFSPSEGKTLTKIVFDRDNFDFLETLPLNGDELRKNIFQYLEMFHQDDHTLAQLLGVKNLGSKSVLQDLSLSANLAKTANIQAINLYSGVAYKALDFENLPLNAKEFILENVFIFSNLFGMVRSSDFLRYYKYSQNFKSQDFSMPSFYKKMASKIDVILGDQEILDLRSEVYIKAYPIKKQHFRVEFFKNGKKVSHYAKHYRGIYLRNLSLFPDKKLEDLSIDGLKLAQIKTQDNATALSYEITL